MKLTDLRIEGCEIVRRWRLLPLLHRLRGLFCVWHGCRDRLGRLHAELDGPGSQSALAQEPDHDRSARRLAGDDLQELRGVYDRLPVDFHHDIA
ncbi:MAG: hypothetical protein WA005_07740, partial [Candidatus Binataceae bacterium]